MIGAFARLPIFVLLLAPAVWVGWLTLGGRDGLALVPEHEALARAYHDSESVGHRRRWAAQQAAWIEEGIPRGPAGTSGKLGQGLEITLLHLRILTDILFVGAHLAVVAVLVGVLLRERLRYVDGAYASPTAAYLGRMVVLGGSLYLFTFAFTPLALPIWGIFAAVGSVGLGGLLYAANLPLRL